MVVKCSEYEHPVDGLTTPRSVLEHLFRLAKVDDRLVKLLLRDTVGPALVELSDACRKLV